MTKTLPPDLASLLEQVGGRWPETDEDGVRDVADAWRALSAKLAVVNNDGVTYARKIANDNAGVGIDSFAGYWSSLETHLGTAIATSEATAEVVDGVAQATSSTKDSIRIVLERAQQAIEQADQMRAVPIANAAAGPAAMALPLLLGPLIRLLLKFLGRFLEWAGRILGDALARLWKRILELLKKLGKKIFNRKPKISQGQRMRDDFEKLPSGSSKNVRLVRSEKELREYFDKWKDGAKRLPPRGEKIPEVYELDDGSIIQWRTTSKSGGATIDITSPGTKPTKVHIK